MSLVWQADPEVLWEGRQVDGPGFGKLVDLL